LQYFAATRVRLQRSAPDDITTLQGVSAQPLSAGDGKILRGQVELVS